MSSKIKKTNVLVSNLLEWFAQNARDLPWRRTQDPYAIWVSEIMLQQTQVKTVLPFWERWMRELPTIEAVAEASPDKIHKLWEGLGYYTRVRNLQKASQQIVKDCSSRGKGRVPEAQIKTGEKSELPDVSSYDNGSATKAAQECRTPKRKRDTDDRANTGSCEFPKTFEEVLALPGIGRYTAGAICSIAFNQPTPLLDGNVMRVLTRIFGVTQDPREKGTNELLWKLAEELVTKAKEQEKRVTDADKLKLELQRDGNCCSHLNQSLMELGALVCTPRNPQCLICPVKKLCVAFKENRTEELPNIGKRAAATARRFVAFVVEHRGKFLVQQRPEKVVNAHLWEFPNVETNGHGVSAAELFKTQFGFEPPELLPLPVIKHSITRYRITLEAFRVPLKKAPKFTAGMWLSHEKFDSVAFTAAHKKLANFAVNRMIADR